MPWPIWPLRWLPLDLEKTTVWRRLALLEHICEIGLQDGGVVHVHLTVLKPESNASRKVVLAWFFDPTYWVTEKGVILSSRF